jgi:SNW domain-containing protein 1
MHATLLACCRFRCDLLLHICSTYVCWLVLTTSLLLLHLPHLLLLQEQTISDKFASLSEALQVAESKAREATEMRKHVALEMARRQKQAKDEQLRKLAQQARMERGGPLAAAAAGGGGGGLASRLDVGGAAAAGAAEMPRYPGPPGAAGGGGGGGYRGDESPGSSEDEERRRGSRRRDESSRGRVRDEYQETAQVRRLVWWGLV